MSRLLVVEGNPRETTERMAALGVASYGKSYSELLDALNGGAACTVVYPSEEGPDCLPDGASLSDFDGIVWTGSSLSVYESCPEVAHQLALAEKALESGTPIFGSCWGLQVFVTVLGGTVRKNPRGREIGLAEKIVQTRSALLHDMYKGKPNEFDAYSVHRDETSNAPLGAKTLARNRKSMIQALSYEREGVSFWGVQYHPEFDCRTLAATIRRNADALVEEGISDAPDAWAEEVTGWEDAPGTIPETVFDERLRRLEIINWLETRVGKAAVAS